MKELNLISEKEVMSQLGISSRQTMYNYQKKHCFPKPIRTHPKAYLENAVNQWILNGGINQKAAS
ncbi:TPA: AlpA family phage regulatory protein [Serratia marcescens]|uniref:helix-turn-helix transcriptional regulator n=1 Tax=Serratia ureilytica TaxID=300181 RepID=UPI0029DEE2DE|nr:AlpA family phage regulatory protein [Serratia marcescens]HEJ7182467.1 AlpA family phage regulatory protein [Serratia marcescens]HEJ7211792.1 AlpA family phage regulatory protein [Serratia marcescens]